MCYFKINFSDTAELYQPCKWIWQKPLFKPVMRNRCSTAQWCAAEAI
jgi:hypothetical protein